MKTQRLPIPVLIFIGAAIFFIPFLGASHLFDWDEINFAEISREMVLTNNYLRPQVNFQPFWEKPPLFFWMQTVSMKWFGFTEFAARFPNAICGITTLLVLFFTGRKIKNSKFGLLWTLAYAGSLFPNLYFKSGIIDPWFNLFTYLSVYFFILYNWKRNDFDKTNLKYSQATYAILSGLFMGLAILTKGQVSLMVFMLALGVYLIYQGFRIFFSWWHVLVYLVAAFVVTLTWYGYETIVHGPWFVTEFIKYQYRLLTTHDAGQKGFFGYHYVVILLGCFPASVLAIPSFFKSKYDSKNEKDFKLWMLILFWVVTILFTLVQSRIIHYSSMAWFPVTYLGATTIYNLSEQKQKWNKFSAVLMSIIGGLIALLLLAVPFFAMNIQKLVPYVKNKFAQGNMQANVHWSGSEGIAGVLLVIVLIVGLIQFKKGNSVKAAWILFAGNALVIFFASVLIVPKVEQYSQDAAIEFFQQRIGEDCYVETLGYKSYAQLFYTQKQKPANEKSLDRDWLLTGDIDKPAYFVGKADHEDAFTKYPELKELYRKNGFVFLKREVPQK